MIIKILSVVLGTFLFLRATSFVQGKNIKKLFGFEGFLFWQKVLGIYYFILLIYFVIFDNSYFYLFILINLILDGLFYLQPTPRTTNKLFYISLILNSLALLYVLLDI